MSKRANTKTMAHGISTEAIIKHNEEKYKVELREDYDHFTLIVVDFPKCPHPKKVMVYDKHNAPGDMTQKNPYKGVRINPHFGFDSSPLARFEPTEHGITCARFLISTLEKHNKGRKAPWQNSQED